MSCTPAVAGEPHARAGGGGAPRCAICWQRDGHDYALHAAYNLGCARAILAIIAGTTSGAEARKLAKDMLDQIDADPIVGVRR